MICIHIQHKRDIKDSLAIGSGHRGHTWAAGTQLGVEAMQPDDLSTLEVLDENTIVHALRGRFKQEKFYVSTFRLIS